MSEFVDELWKFGQDVSNKGRELFHLGERYLIPNDQTEQGVNRFLTYVVSTTLTDFILHEALCQQGITVIEGVPNRFNYGFALRDHKRGWRGDPKKDAEILLALEHLSFGSNLQGRYPRNVIKIGAAKFPMNTQIKLFERSEQALQVLKREVSGLDWEEIYNWAVASIVIDQGNDFSSFSSKSEKGVDLSYDGIYRLFEVHSSAWISNRNNALNEYFKGVLFDDFGWGYVSHGTTSFAVPVAGSLLMRVNSKESVDSYFVPRGYVRPFQVK